MVERCSVGLKVVRKPLRGPLSKVQIYLYGSRLCVDFGCRDRAGEHAGNVGEGQERSPSRAKAERTTGHGVQYPYRFPDFILSLERGHAVGEPDAEVPSLSVRGVERLRETFHRSSFSSSPPPLLLPQKPRE